MGKKDEIDDLADELIANIDQDRKRISNFLDDLLKIEDISICADSIAKLADALTRQNALRMNAIKAKVKAAELDLDSDEDTDSFFESNGRPFSIEDGN